VQRYGVGMLNLEQNFSSCHRKGNVLTGLARKIYSRDKALWMKLFHLDSGDKLSIKSARSKHNYDKMLYDSKHLCNTMRSIQIHSRINEDKNQSTLHSLCSSSPSKFQDMPLKWYILNHYGFTKFECHLWQDSADLFEAHTSFLYIFY